MHKVVEEISDGNSWRDGEFAKYRVNPFGVDELFWYRMCVPMIYAHWEGFVVNSLKQVLSHLNKLQLTSVQVPTRLVVVGLGDTYRTLSGKQSFEQRISFTEKFHVLLNNSIKFKTKIETRSNLNSDVLQELCHMFDFDFTRFQDLTAILDRIVHVRNSIAHGENSIIPTLENINNYIEVVKRATDILLEEIDIFLDEVCYLLNRTA